MFTRAQHNLYRFEPTEDEEQKAREDIAHHEGAIEQLNVELADLFQQARRIKEQKRWHEEAICRSKGVLTLARRIPAELLAKIFEHSVKLGWTRAPVVVSQVCSAWREAANTPSVWSHIYLDCDRGDPVAKLNFWLSRARNTDLHVTLRTSEDLSTLEEVLEILMPTIPRWRSFMLETPTVSSANHVLVRCKENAVLLEEVGLLMADDSATAIGLINGAEAEDGRLLSFREAFAESERLHHISFKSDIPRSWMSLPQVTSLSLSLNLCQFRTARPILSSEILDVLRESPNLVQCTMMIPRMDARDFLISDASQFVVMPQLEHLILNFPSHFMILLAQLRAPRLRTLILRSPDDIHGFAVESMRLALREFITQSAPPLEKFELYDVDISEDDFNFCFDNMDALQELCLHGSEILDDTLKRLAAPLYKCPKLSKLDLRWCGHLTGDALVEVVLNRSAALFPVVKPIEDIRIISCSFVRETDVLELGRLSFCHLKVPTSDFCHPRGCCDNARYRARFRSRHLSELSEDPDTRIEL